MPRDGAVRPLDGDRVRRGVRDGKLELGDGALHLAAPSHEILLTERRDLEMARPPRRRDRAAVAPAVAVRLVDLNRDAPGQIPREKKNTGKKTSMIPDDTIPLTAAPTILRASVGLRSLLWGVKYSGERT